jgi:enoyl-CoA hydratase/carnithine racemase
LTTKIETQRVGSALILTIDGPETRNALSPEVYVAAAEALASADRDPSVSAVVITGAGGQFCSGGMLQRLMANRTAGPDTQRGSIDRLHGLIDGLRSCSKPVIAAVEGSAAGAGCSLALNCDMIVASETARFVMAYVNVGLSPDGGGSWHLVRSLPRQLASEILMLGAPVSAAKLHQAGIVNRLVPEGQARSAALELADQIGQRPKNVLASLKELIGAAQTDTLTEHLLLERESFVASLFHANALEGLDAFLSKRKPGFT